MRGNGGYSIRNNKLYVYGVVDGKRHRVSTGKEATSINIAWIKKNHWSVLLKLIDKKEQQTKHSLDLEKFCLEVVELSSHKRDSQTQKDYISKINRMIIPYFKSFSIEDIRVFDIEKWQNALLEKYSTTTVRRARNILNMVLKKAVANDLITKNPIEYADNINVVHEKQEPYSIEEMTLILKSAAGWLKVFLYLAFTTGMRPGELLGLQWDDIDFDRRVIYLQRSISKGVVKQDTSTKNHNRLVVVADFVLDMLLEHRSTSKTEWIFTSRLGLPYSESKAITNKHFKPLLEKIGVKYKSLKATRHTYISIMRNAGVSSELILEIVGHSKEVSDKHYYTAEINDHKILAVNNVFHDLRIDVKGTVKAQ